MYKIIRITFFSFFLFTALFGSSKLFCAEKAHKTIAKTYEGRIGYINWVTSSITVNGVGSMEFYVPREARITKLGGATTLANINILDYVIIKYNEDPSGQNIVTRMTVVVL